MKTNIDCEIYISNFINFFENNPNDLIILIGETSKELFYGEVRTQVYKNYGENGEIVLTQKQVLDIIINIHKTENKEIDKSKIQKIPYFQTKFGKFILN